jgi:tetratricopeptide (TPR) repeat protein
LARARPEFDRVVVEPTANEARYQAAFAELQCGPRSKLLDLRGVRTVQFGQFGRLADAWKVGGETIPRLGIVLGYEHWVRFHAVAARRLGPIERGGVEVEIFHALQFPDVPAWFAGDRVGHPLPAILEWLRVEWQPSPIWTQVLDTTAMLITGFGHRQQVPDQLLQLAAIALSLRGVDAATEAVKLVQTALAWIGETPSRMRCRALRQLASAMLILGETEAALAWLDEAINVAALIRDPLEEASALADVGAYALRRGHFAHAEARFRGALALLSADFLPYLRATLHHQLANALHEQRKTPDEAERHASEALALRWDPESRLAREDRALLARIRADRGPEPAPQPP